MPFAERHNRKLIGGKELLFDRVGLIFLADPIFQSRRYTHNPTRAFFQKQKPPRINGLRLSESPFFSSIFSCRQIQFLCYSVRLSIW